MVIQKTHNYKHQKKCTFPEDPVKFGAVSTTEPNKCNSKIKLKKDKQEQETLLQLVIKA